MINDISIDVLINGLNIFLLIIIVIFMVVKDKEGEKKIKNIEIAIDELLKEGHKNSQILTNLCADENKNNDKLIDEKINALKLELENDIKYIKSLINSNMANGDAKEELKQFVKNELDIAISPLIKNLNTIEEDIKDFQFDQQDRMANLEQKNKQASQISMMSQNEEEKQILNMHLKGESIEDISRQLGVPSGRVEFIIKLNSQNA